MIESPESSPKFNLPRQRKSRHRRFKNQELNVNIVEESLKKKRHFNYRKNVSKVFNSNKFIEHMDKRVKGFPFQQTPSGNLKIIPNQVS